MKNEINKNNKSKSIAKLIEDLVQNLDAINIKNLNLIEAKQKFLKCLILCLPKAELYLQENKDSKLKEINLLRKNTVKLKKFFDNEVFKGNDIAKSYYYSKTDKLKSRLIDFAIMGKNCDPIGYMSGDSTNCAKVALDLAAEFNNADLAKNIFNAFSSYRKGYLTNMQVSESLVIAASKGNFDVVKAILKLADNAWITRGVSRSKYKDKYGNNLSHYLGYYGNENIIKIFLKSCIYSCTNNISYYRRYFDLDKLKSLILEKNFFGKNMLSYMDARGMNVKKIMVNLMNEFSNYSYSLSSKIIDEILQNVPKNNKKIDITPKDVNLLFEKRLSFGKLDKMYPGNISQVAKDFHRGSRIIINGEKCKTILKDCDDTTNAKKLIIEILSNIKDNNKKLILTNYFEKFAQQGGFMNDLETQFSLLFQSCEINKDIASGVIINHQFFRSFDVDSNRIVVNLKFGVSGINPCSGLKKDEIKPLGNSKYILTVETKAIIQVKNNKVVYSMDSVKINPCDIAAEMLLNPFYEALLKLKKKEKYNITSGKKNSLKIK